MPARLNRCNNKHRAVLHKLLRGVPRNRERIFFYEIAFRRAFRMFRSDNPHGAHQQDLQGARVPDRSGEQPHPREPCRSSAEHSTRRRLAPGTLKLECIKGRPCFLVELIYLWAEAKCPLYPLNYMCLSCFLPSSNTYNHLRLASSLPSSLSSFLGHPLCCRSL